MVVQLALTPRIALLFASPLTHSEDDDANATPVEIEPLNLEAEQKLLHDVFTKANRQIRVSVGVATRDTLLTQIAKGNTRIIHYAGHGVRDGLGFEDGEGGLYKLTTAELNELLRDSSISQQKHNQQKIASGDDASVTPPPAPPSPPGGVQLAFVSACQSEDAGNAFVAAGVPHVVAVRWDAQVTDRASHRFAMQFYLSLAMGATVQQAFDQAQTAVEAAPRISEESRLRQRHKFLLLPRDANHNIRILEDLKPGLPEDDDEEHQHETQRTTSPVNYCNGVPLNFVGRRILMHHIIRHLVGQKRRWITLAGQPSVGKVTCAAAVCAHLVQRKAVDAVYFASISPNVHHYDKFNPHRRVYEDHLLRTLRGVVDADDPVSQAWDIEGLIKAFARRRVVLVLKILRSGNDDGSLSSVGDKFPQEPLHHIEISKVVANLVKRSPTLSVIISCDRPLPQSKRRDAAVVASNPSPNHSGHVKYGGSRDNGTEQLVLNVPPLSRKSSADLFVSCCPRMGEHTADNCHDGTASLGRVNSGGNDSMIHSHSGFPNGGLGDSTSFGSSPSLASLSIHIARSDSTKTTRSHIHRRHSTISRRSESINKRILHGPLLADRLVRRDSPILDVLRGVPGAIIRGAQRLHNVAAPPDLHAAASRLRIEFPHHSLESHVDHMWENEKVSGFPDNNNTNNNSNNNNSNNNNSPTAYVTHVPVDQHIHPNIVQNSRTVNGIHQGRANTSERKQQSQPKSSAELQRHAIGSVAEAVGESTYGNALGAGILMPRAPIQFPINIRSSHSLNAGGGNSESIVVAAGETGGTGVDQLAHDLEATMSDRATLDSTTTTRSSTTTTISSSTELAAWQLMWERSRCHDGTVTWRSLIGNIQSEFCRVIYGNRLRGGHCETRTLSVHDQVTLKRKLLGHEDCADDVTVSAHQLSSFWVWFRLVTQTLIKVCDLWTCHVGTERLRLLQGFKSRRNVEEMMQGAVTGTFLLRLNERVCATGALLTLSFVERASEVHGERSRFAHVLVQCLEGGGFRRREGTDGVVDFSTLAELLSDSRLRLYYPGWEKHEVLKSSIFH